MNKDTLTYDSLIRLDATLFMFSIKTQNQALLVLRLMNKWVAVARLWTWLTSSS